MTALIVAGLIGTGFIIAGLVAGFTGSLALNMVASEGTAWAPHLGHWLIRRAARWVHPDEREDFVDEHRDLLEHYSADGRNLTCVVIGLREYQRAARTGGLPTWAAEFATDSLEIIASGAAIALMSAFCVTFAAVAISCAFIAVVTWAFAVGGIFGNVAIAVFAGSVFVITFIGIFVQMVRKDLIELLRSSLQRASERFAAEAGR